MSAASGRPLTALERMLATKASGGKQVGKVTTPAASPLPRYVHAPAAGDVVTLGKVTVVVVGVDSITGIRVEVYHDEFSMDGAPVTVATHTPESWAAWATKAARSTTGGA